MAPQPKLEIACFNTQSALIAQANGANRIELCDGFEVGGTTPSSEMIRKVKAETTIPVYVMIRPRGGGFVYSDEEFRQMKSAVTELKKENVDGFVFGILSEDQTVNLQQNQELVWLASPLPCTFHRAFDEVTDAFSSLEAVIGCGFTTILTSGQAPNVMGGAERLGELAVRAGNRIAIMPGGGLRSSNIAQIQLQTGADWFHSSAITQGGQTANAAEVVALRSNLNALP